MSSMSPVSAKFLIADDYRSHPSYSFPFSKSDDEVANERVEVRIHEHLFTSQTQAFSGSKQDNIKKYETTNKNHTKRLGEVDYTTGRIFTFTTYSARKNTNININDLNRSLAVKDTETITRVHFKNLALTRLSIIAVLIIKESVGTGVLSPRSRPF